MDSNSRANEHPEKRPRRGDMSPPPPPPPAPQQNDPNLKRPHRFSPNRNNSNYNRPHHHRGAPYRNAPPHANDRERRGRPRDFHSRGYDDRFRHPPHHDADRNRPPPSHQRYNGRGGPHNAPDANNDRRYNHPHPPRGDGNRNPRNFQSYNANVERRYSHPPPSRDNHRDGPRNGRDFPYPERQRFQERNPPRGRYHDQGERYRGPPPQPRRSLSDNRRRPPPEPHRLPPDERNRGYRREDNYRDSQRPRSEHRGGNGIYDEIRSCLEEANRFARDLDEKRAIIVSSLEFSDDRGAVAKRVKSSIMLACPELRIRYVFPLGRRFPSCFIQFDDQKSKESALSMGSFAVLGRSANIHPLERPYLVSFRDPTEIQDIQTSFDIGGIREASNFGESVFELPDARAMVRLLSMDGFPYGKKHPHNERRYVAVRSFTPGQQFNPGSSSHRKKENERSQNQFKIRFKYVPQNVPMREVYSFLENNGCYGVRVERTNPHEVTVYGQYNSENRDLLYRTTYDLRNHNFSDPQREEQREERERDDSSKHGRKRPHPDNENEEEIQPLKKNSLSPNGFPFPRISPLTPPTPPKP